MTARTITGKEAQARLAELGATLEEQATAALVRAMNEPDPREQARHGRVAWKIAKNALLIQRSAKP